MRFKINIKQFVSASYGNNITADSFSSGRTFSQYYFGNSRNSTTKRGKRIEKDNVRVFGRGEFSRPLIRETEIVFDANKGDTTIGNRNKISFARFFGSVCNYFLWSP